MEIGREQERERSKNQCSVHENTCAIYIILKKLFEFSFELKKWQSYIVAWWGRARSSFAFRTVTPSTAICIKMEERGEEAGMISGRREQEGVNRCRKKREL